MTQFQQDVQWGFLHRVAPPTGHTADTGIQRHARRRTQWWFGTAVICGLIWGPGPVRGEIRYQPVPPAEDKMPASAQARDAAPDGHDDVLVAGFGFQGLASSSITIRTYQRRTGEVLAEDSYDLNVQDEGTSADAKHGRIFAGGIGVARDGRSRFLLRVYDALNGRFLWEGQLNLIAQNEGRRARPIATVVFPPAAMRRAGVTRPLPVDVELSLRAVDSQTGRLVWEEHFIPGAPMTGQVERIVSPGRAGQTETIGHVFDLIVRALDRTSGRLLWQDSFEETAPGTGTGREEGRLLEPGSMPFWNREGPAWTLSTVPFRENYDRGCCRLD
jgi:hypothetical protein